MLLAIYLCSDASCQLLMNVGSFVHMRILAQGKFLQKLQFFMEYSVVESISMHNRSVGLDS